MTIKAVAHRHQIVPLANALYQGMPAFEAEKTIQAYHQLPTLSRQTIDNNVLPGLSVDTLQKNAQSGALAFCEELADALFEVERLSAAKKGVIPHMGAPFWLKVHQQIEGPQKISFTALMSEVSKAMPEKSVAEFQKICGLPEAESRQFLALLTLRMGYEGGISYTRRNEHYRYQLTAVEEIQELLDEVKKPTLKEALFVNVLKVQAKLIQHFDLPLPRLTGWAVRSLLHARLNDTSKAISDAALMRLADFKRTLRSEINYQRMPEDSFKETMSQAQRKAQNIYTKAIAKPMEALSVACAIQGSAPAFEIATP
ncbi:MAG: hypothetical protein VKK59_05095 [Vampirovibrionales bacterium]|nr:hypothetical protein [Vampirovibrionales bacterium]